MPRPKRPLNINIADPGSGTGLTAASIPGEPISPFADLNAPLTPTTLNVDRFALFRPAVLSNVPEVTEELPKVTAASGDVADDDA